MEQRRYEARLVVCSLTITSFVTSTTMSFLMLYHFILPPDYQPSSSYTQLELLLIRLLIQLLYEYHESILVSRARPLHPFSCKGLACETKSI